MSRRKNIALAASAAVLALGLGVGATSMASATTTPAPVPGASTKASAGNHQDKGGHSKAGGQMVSELAAKLGVDEAKLAEAFKTFKQANKPVEGTHPDGSAREAALAKSLAASLGLDEAKVAAALSDLRSEHKAEGRAAALKARLDKAVAAGTLTQAEADAVTKAVEKGVFGGPKK